MLQWPHNRVDSDESESMKTASNGVQVKKAPLEDPKEGVKATLETSKLISLNLKANWIRITSWIGFKPLREFLNIKTLRMTRR